MLKLDPREKLSETLIHCMALDDVERLLKSCESLVESRSDLENCAQILRWGLAWSLAFIQHRLQTAELNDLEDVFSPLWAVRIANLARVLPVHGTDVKPSRVLHPLRLYKEALEVARPDDWFDWWRGKHPEYMTKDKFGSNGFDTPFYWRVHRDGHLECGPQNPSNLPEVER